MKLNLLFVGVFFVFSTSHAWDEGSQELGAYTVRDVTRQYPQMNYYDQLQECTETQVPADLAQPPSVNGQPSLQAVPQLPVITPGLNETGNNSGFPTSGSTILEPPGGGNMTPNMPYVPATGVVRLDQIVNIGVFVWSLVERSKPTMRVSTSRAHGLPAGIRCWTDLEEWKIPKSFVYSVEQKSKVGKEIIKFTFRISYVYGGHFNGKGKYLANVTVSPVDLKVGWATDFASEVHIPSVFNVGTKIDPMAAMQIYVYWSMGKTTQMRQKSLLFHVTGDGKIQLTEQN